MGETLIAQINQMEELAGEYWQVIDPELSTAYWRSLLDKRRLIGYSDEELEGILAPSKRDAVEATSNLRTRIMKSVGKVFFRLQQARGIIEAQRAGTKLPANSDFLLSAVTTRLGYFDFANSAHDVIVGVLGQTQADIRIPRFQTFIRQSSLDLFRPNVSIAGNHTQLRLLMAGEVFPAVNMVIKA